MDVDVLVLVASALADLFDPVRPNQSEALRQHARRGVEVAEALDALGGEARLFLQLLDRGPFDGRIRVEVANEAGRKLDAAAAGRDARLIDQDHLTLIFGEDHDRVDVVGAARIFPFAALQGPNEIARPHHFRRRQIVEVHSSMSLSGISLVSPAVRGKCSASTAPIRSIAAQMPSPGRPSRTAAINMAMASPQVCSSVTLRIASSATISARRSAIER